MRPRSFISSKTIQSLHHGSNRCLPLRLSRSVRLDRQRRVLRPFAHGAIVERQVLVAELMEQEQIDGRRYAAAAITNHLLVLADSPRLERSFRIGQSDN